MPTWHCMQCNDTIWLQHALAQAALVSNTLTILASSWTLHFLALMVGFMAFMAEALGMALLELAFGLAFPLGSTLAMVLITLAATSYSCSGTYFKMPHGPGQVALGFCMATFMDGMTAHRRLGFAIGQLGCLEQCLANT